MAKSKQFFFLGGLPRSGSTVMASVLSQHPAIYASPNSPLVNMLVNVNRHLLETEQAKAFLQPTQRTDVLRYLMEGLYAFSDASIIIDKSRAWPHPHNLALLEEVLGQQVKLIAMVRDLPSILASFLRKIHEHPETVSFVDKTLRDRRQVCTDKNRLQVLFSPDGTVYEAWYTLKQAFDEGWADRIHIIEYDDFVSQPEQTMNELYDFMDVPAFSHDFAHIINKTPEDDTVYNLPGLHVVRPQLQKTAPHPRDLLGLVLYETYAGVPHFWRAKASVVNPLWIKTATHQRL
jgi:sulfotransferase